MSLEAMGWAYKQEKLSPVEKFVLVTLGNEADKAGVTFCGQLRISEACSTTVKTVSGHCVTLEEKGLIRRVRRKRPNGSRTSDYTVLAPAAVDRGAMVSAAKEEVPEEVYLLTVGTLMEDSLGNEKGGTRPVSSLDSSSSSQSTLDGTATSGNVVKSAAKKPVSYRGKRVPTDTVKLGEALLQAFNEATGRALSARKADGTAQPVLTQILGTLLDMPETNAEMWFTAIRHTVRNPPGWTEGRQLQIGDVFGGKARDHALSNNGRPSAKGRSKNADTLDLADRLIAGEFGE